jgi:hypothetical protein
MNSLYLEKRPIDNRENVRSSCLNWAGTLATLCPNYSKLGKFLDF